MHFKIALQTTPISLFIKWELNSSTEQHWICMKYRAVSICRYLFSNEFKSFDVLANTLNMDSNVFQQLIELHTWQLKSHRQHSKPGCTMPPKYNAAAALLLGERLFHKAASKGRGERQLIEARSFHPRHSTDGPVPALSCRTATKFYSQKTKISFWHHVQSIETNDKTRKPGVGILKTFRLAVAKLLSKKLRRNFLQLSPQS